MFTRFLSIFTTRKKHAIVFGESNASTSEAVQEALLAIQNAANVGYTPISIGGGAGSAAVASDYPSEIPPAGGSLVTVYVLLEGPATVPDIVPATGIPAP